MSSFFTLPASARKRKRSDGGATSKTGAEKSARKVRAVGKKSNGPRRADRNASISGSDSGDNASSQIASEEGSDASSSHEGETGAERRLRLAERYLQNVREEVQRTGFDAEEVDRELLAERLKEDVAESKGRMYRFVANSYDYGHGSRAHFRGKTDAVTGVAVCAPHVYTVSKDIRLIKWELPAPDSRGHRRRSTNEKRPPVRQRPRRLLSTQGSKTSSARSSAQHQTAKRMQIHHTAPILCVAASPDGRYVATGGHDKKLIIWAAADLTPLRVFSQHRDTLTALSIDRTLNRLYSASYDRTIKTWGLNEQAYVETLFGHQDHIVGVVALPGEKCLSAGARDRTVRLWKVADETQLVFRGGGGGGGGGGAGAGERTRKKTAYAEGSIDHVAMIDDETFVTGSDNGSLHLWTTQKKKPVFTYACAHGLEPALTPAEAYAEKDLAGRIAPAPPQPRWITALASVPYSDLVVSGSWDGVVRAWRVSADKKRLEPAGVIGVVGGDVDVLESKNDPRLSNGVSDGQLVRVNGGDKSHRGDDDDDNDDDKQDGHNEAARGIVNDLAIFERGDRGKEGLCIVAALGRTHRLGRWRRMPDGKNGAVVFEIAPSRAARTKQGAGKRKQAATLRATGSAAGE